MGIVGLCLYEAEPVRPTRVSYQALSEVNNKEYRYKKERAPRFRLSHPMTSSHFSVSPLHHMCSLQIWILPALIQAARVFS